MKTIIFLGSFLFLFCSPIIGQIETFEDETANATSFTTGALTFNTSGDILVETNATPLGCDGSSFWLGSGFGNGGTAGTAFGGFQVANAGESFVLSTSTTMCVWTSNDDGNNLANGDIEFVGTLAGGGTISEIFPIMPPNNLTFDVITFSNAIWGGQSLTALNMNIANSSTLNFIAIDNIPFASLAPVPVTLSSFQAAIEKDAVALHWQTSSEQNNSHFIIERSTDGIQFSSIGQVNGAGTTTQVTDYQFMDSRPANGLNYYRLQQVDYDGTTDYSTVEVVAVNSQERQLGAIFPNPSKDGQFQVDYHVPKAEQIQVSILDYTGKVLRSKQMQLENGLNRLQFNLNDLGQGVYILQLNTGGLLESRKVVVN